MPKIPIWIGYAGVLEVTGSPILERDNTRFAVTRIYEGPYAAVLTGQPTQNQAFNDLPAACMVTSVRVEKLPGGIGRLTVKAETAGPSDEQPFAPTFENEWVEVDRPVELHPMYSDGTDPVVFGGATGKYALNIGDRTAVQQWQNEDDFTLKAAYQFKILSPSGTTAPTGYTVTSPSKTIGTSTYDVYTLSANAQNLAKKLLRGETSYRVYAPVARQTIQSTTLPTSNPCAVIENPPSLCQPPEGYVWLRSAQAGTKTGRYGKWVQKQEWQGADAIDTDLYQNA